MWSAYGQHLKALESPAAKSYRDRFPSALIPILDKFKQVGFYVTYFAEEGFMLPGKLGQDNLATVRHLITFARRRVRAFEQLHGTVARSRRVVKRARELDSQLPKEIKDAVIRNMRRSVER